MFCCTQSYSSLSDITQSCGIVLTFLYVYNIDKVKLAMSSSIFQKCRQVLTGISSTLDLGKVDIEIEEVTSGTSVAKASARRRTHESLRNILISALMRDEEDVYLENEAASNLCIALCDLELENNGPASQDGSSFFNPMSSERLESFPFDRTDRATNSFLCASDCWDGSKPTPTGFWVKPDAGCLVGELRWLVGGCQRIFPTGDRRTYLHRAVNWKHKWVSSTLPIERNKIV